MKKFWSMLLALLLVMSSISALAESDGNEDAVDFALYDENGNLVTDVEQGGIETGDLSLTEHEGDWWNILLLGEDSRDRNHYARTDAIIVLSVNTKQNKVKMTSIMRDTWVEIAGKGYNKINTANVFGGTDLAMQTVNANFGLDIEDYVMINMFSLATVIDKLGGVDMDVSEKEMSIINQNVGEYSDYADDAVRLKTYGENTHLTGDQALALVQNRMQDSDYQRTSRQRRLLVALARKLQKTSAADILGLVTDLSSYVTTNLSFFEMVQLATVGLQVELSELEDLRLPADGTFESGMYNGYWSIRPDFAENTRLMHEFIYGEGEQTEPTGDDAEN